MPIGQNENVRADTSFDGNVAARDGCTDLLIGAFKDATDSSGSLPFGNESRDGEYEEKNASKHRLDNGIWLTSCVQPRRPHNRSVRRRLQVQPTTSLELLLYSSRPLIEPIELTR
jgi:hypothetical protein